MSVSQHPIALRLERRVGGSTKLLATVMALPLIDGIFPALVVAGVLASTAGILETGILIFGGSATMAVILAEMDGTRKEMALSVLLIGAVIVPVAAIQAALAPTLEGFLNLEIFERFAGLVILAIAAKTASSEIGEYLPSPAVIIGLGLVASFDPANVAVETSMEYVVPGIAAAGVGVAFALAVALLSPQLKGRVDIDRFRFGSAVALGVLALPILLRPVGVMQTDVPVALAVLGVTALFAYDPDADGIGAVVAPVDPDEGPDGGGGEASEGSDRWEGVLPEGPGTSDAADQADTPAEGASPGGSPGRAPTKPPLDTSVIALVSRAGDRDSIGDDPVPAPIAEDDADGSNDDVPDPVSDEDSRAPWL